jgi:pimeloyl-ACP methyl ester carboxylesterase
MNAMHEVEVSAGTIRYRDTGGEGPVVLFVHGLLVNGMLWRDVVAELDGVRCVVPDWPLGCHEPALDADADLSPRAVAGLVDEFAAALGLEDVTLVANDTGGAIAQLVVTERPERIGRVVLTNCDAFENFLPPAFRPLQWLARVPPVLTAAVQGLRSRRVARSPLGFGLLSHRRLADDVVDSFRGPPVTSRGARRDAVKVLRGVDNRDTLRAAERLGAFPGPALVAWGLDDPFFKTGFGRRLAECFGDGRFEGIEDSKTFVAIDQPTRLAGLIRRFAVT